MHWTSNQNILNFESEQIPVFNLLKMLADEPLIQALAYRPILQLYQAHFQHHQTIVSCGLK